MISPINRTPIAKKPTRYYSSFVLPDEAGAIRSHLRLFDYTIGTPAPHSTDIASVARTNLKSFGQPLRFDRWHAIVSAPLVDEVVDFLANSYAVLNVDRGIEQFEAPLLHLVRETLLLPEKPDRAVVIDVYFPNLRANAHLLEYLRAPYGSILTLASHHGIPIPEDLAARDAAARLGGIEPSPFYGWIILGTDQ